jgi:hypothetical protein
MTTKTFIRVGVGYQKTQNFMLIPNSLSWAQNVPKKLLAKTKEKFTNSEKIKIRTAFCQ